MTRRPAPFPVFALLFVVSGGAGLVYQVVWSRQLVSVFGVTAFSVATVLASFMGGMALGAALLGRRADRAARPLRMFALLEGGIGAYALVLPWLLAAVDAFQEGVVPYLPDSFALRSALRFVLCLGLLLVPTSFMGATLPALGQGLLRSGKRIGRGVGLLYFVNTLGAAAGCYAAGFWLLPTLGLPGATLVAAGLNGTVAILAFVLDARRPREIEDDPVPVDAPGDGPVPEAREIAPAWPLAVAFASGFAALAFEIAWFRALVLVFGSTVYSFTAMLSVFLLGLALGSILLGPLADRARRPIRVLALTQGAVALFTLGGVLAADAMPRAFLQLLAWSGESFEGMHRAKMLLALATILPPALAFGGTFPVVVRLAGRGHGKGRIGSRIGRVYAWNTLGAIAGSFATGFLLLPTVGAERVLEIVVLIALAACFGSVLAEPGPLAPRWAVSAGLAVVLVLAVLVLSPPWDRKLLGAGVYYQPSRFIVDGHVRDPRSLLVDYRLVVHHEGYNDTISAFETPRERFVSVSGSPTASDSFDDLLIQRMQGHAPALLHPGPLRKALIVGLGSGITAGAVALHEPERLTVVELERGVLDSARFFSEANAGVLDFPALDLRIDDARSFLKVTDERFDVISSAPNFPSLSGAGALYTTDFLDLCRRRLAPGGTVCHWSPISRIATEDVRRIVGSFVDVFPYVRVFSNGLSVILLGREEPFPPVDVEEIGRRYERPGVRESLGAIGVRGPVEMLSFFLFDTERARRFANGVPRTSDAFPRLEFSAPRAMFDRTIGVNLAALAALRPDLEERARLLGVPEPYVSSYRALAAAYDATVDGQVLASGEDVAAGLSLLIPAADSGQRFARYVVARYLRQVARREQDEGNLAAARGSLEHALRYEPDDHDGLIALGSLAFGEGRLDEARALLERAVRLYPRSRDAAVRYDAVNRGQQP